MAKPTKIFAVSVDGTPRTLFAIKESPTGKLTLIVKHGMSLTRSNSYLVSEGSEIIGQKFSIHLSHRSTTNANALHHTVIKQNGTEDSYNYTQAIKLYDRFAELYSERCRNLSEARYTVPEQFGDRVVSLGDYTHELFQLVYSVFIGRSGKQFVLYGAHDLNYITQHFSAFSVTVIWSFLSLPSDSTGNLGVMQTLREDETYLLKFLIISQAAFPASSAADLKILNALNATECNARKCETSISQPLRRTCQKLCRS